MKAAVLEAINSPLQIKDVEIPGLQAGEVLVKLSAAALNHRDVWIYKGQYAGIKTPVILGSDGCGMVEKAGTEVNQDWIGKEVILNPSVNWGDNPRVQHKHYSIIGLPEDGTLAEYIKVKPDNLMVKPSHLSPMEAAALPLAGLTAWRALMTRAQLTTTDRVLVTGCGGGVALFAIQFAIANGNEVWVTSGEEDKIKKAIALGAKGGINYKTENWHKSLLQQSGGFDVIIDSAGGASFNKLIEVANPGGRIAFYGGTLGNIDGLSPQKIFWKQLSLLGSTMGSDQDFATMVQFVNLHRIKPVIDFVVPLEETNIAFQRMAEGKQFGKIVVTIP